MVGSAFSMPILSMGNTAYFGDPMMTGKQYLTGIAAGGLLGGAANGITALANGKTFWSGNVKPPPMTPATIRPELPSLNSSKPEVNTDGLRSRPLEMTPERPVFSETLEPGPVVIKMPGELREVEIVAKGGERRDSLKVQNIQIRFSVR
jgi:hypothetical protein